MTRFTSAIGMTFCAAAVIALSAISGTSAHGYMTKPLPRGIQKASFLVDDLKSPNFKGVCRGEPAGTVTTVGRRVKLEFEITAEHIGKCEVYILNPDFSNPRLIASKDGCAKTKPAAPWTINIPSDITGRKIIRWMWHASHRVTEIEEYEQCADVIINPGKKRVRRDNEDKIVEDIDVEEIDVEEASAPDAPVTPATPATPVAPVVPATPATPVASVTSAAPVASISSASGSCTPGQFKCDGSKFGQCNHGSFVWMACGPGTACKSNGSSVYCG
ncbi:hypothetical protein BDF19DRAFT_498760 [Syncephalis fuscata]|nr:hypothetical protein BDF19DRAFT_498760 [Syncephalis fuscata]